MINSEKIADFIFNPQLLGHEDVANLDEIIGKFPYCSTLHLLKLKAVSSSNSIQFESDLRYGAIHVSDREKMYYLLHSEEAKVKKEEAIGKSEEAARRSEEAKGNSEEAIGRSKEATAKSAVATGKNEEVVVDSTEVKGISEEKEEKANLDKSKNDEKLKSEINKAILPNLIEITIEKELKSETAKENESKELAFKATEKPKKILPEKISLPQKKAQAIDISKLSFVEWLKYKQGTKILEGKSEEDTIHETEKTANTKGNKSHIDALLNKFIEEEPSISKPKTEFFNPAKNAKKSLEESPDLVTETLAKIYLLQKNYTKAINAYEQLILVYPEKKTFFATQIEKIKDEQNK